MSWCFLQSIVSVKYMNSLQFKTYSMRSYILQLSVSLSQASDSVILFHTSPFCLIVLVFLTVCELIALCVTSLAASSCLFSLPEYHHYCQQYLRVMWFLTSWLDNDFRARCREGIRTGRGFPGTYRRNINSGWRLENGVLMSFPGTSMNISGGLRNV